jgi:NAD(P)-dependent dehydrogenase (short-subunit alcohol dehydrogenase family)
MRSLDVLREIGLTKNAAAEYGPQGLRINCVGPAYIETPLLANLPQEFRLRREPAYKKTD